MANFNPVNNEESGYSLRDFVAILFKYKMRILVVFSVVVAAAVVGSFLLTPVYEAKASILIKIGREYMNRSELGEGSKPILSVNQEQITNSEIQILTNRALLKSVVAKVSMDKIYPGLAAGLPPNLDPLDVAAAKLEKGLTVEGVKKSNVVLVSFKHNNPGVAAQVVNTLVELFKEKHLQVYSDPKSSFLEKQLEGYQIKLKESENNLQAYKQKNLVYSIDEQRTMLLKQRFELDTILKNSQHSISESQQRISYLKNQLQNISDSKTRYTNSERDKIVIDAKAKLLTLQLEEQQLLKKYTDDNYMVSNIRKETELVRNFIREQEEDTYGKSKSNNIVYQNVEMDFIKAETELNSQKGKLVTVKQQLSQLDKDIKLLDFNEKQFLELKRDQLINEKNYQTYMGKAEEARISEDMDRLKFANISVIQDATVPGQPVKPNKLFNIALGILFGAVAGVGIALLSESKAKSFSNPVAAGRRLGLPVLAVISNQEG